MIASSFFLAALSIAGVSNALAPPRHLSRSAADLQTSLDLDPSQVQPGLAQNGQATPEAGQVPSLTSTNNFVNFCATQQTTLTNGLQTIAGSCNPTIMGRILANTKLPSAKFSFPPNGGTIAANQTFTISMAINNMVTGNFVAAATNYYAAPCQVDSTGTVIGHSHVVIEKMTSLQQTTVTNPLKFAFFKGINQPATNGVLLVNVTGGLAEGVYRMASINTCANHQPVLASVAQHGHMDDMTYFTVTTDGTADGTGVTGSGALAAGGDTGSTTTTSVAETTTASVASTTTAISTAETTTTASVASTTTAISTAGNLQTFAGALGGAAPTVTGPDATGRFDVNGNTFATVQAALQRSCDIQHNACADEANATGNLASLDQTTCQTQLTQCSAVAAGGSPTAGTPTATTTAAGGKASSTTVTTLANGNLQFFSGVAGGSEAPAVTGPGADGRFSVAGVSGTFSDKAAAIQRSCDVQLNACSNQANATGNMGDLDQTTCQTQQAACYKASP